MTFYHQHQRGKLNRFKVRIRTYAKQSSSFLEVKFKNNQNRTIKNRIAISAEQGQNHYLCPDFLALHKVINAEHLLPIQKCNYARIAFANAGTQERLTIDMNLRFFNFATNRHIELPELVIIELKQARINRQSALYQIIKQYSSRPASCSKYCMGLVLDENTPIYKHNLFKPTLRKVRSISGVIINE